MRDIAQFQAEHGLPRTDVVKTRQNVRLLFTIYRQYKANQSHGVPLELNYAPPGLDEYKDCQDPARIRSGLGTGNKPPDEREMMMKQFMTNVEKKIERMRILQAAILRCKFMGADEVNDVDALIELETLGYCMGEATYHRTKQSAMLKFASMMQVTAFHED